MTGLARLDYSYRDHNKSNGDRRCHGGNNSIAFETAVKKKSSISIRIAATVADTSGCTRRTPPYFTETNGVYAFLDALVKGKCAFAFKQLIGKLSRYCFDERKFNDLPGLVETVFFILTKSRNTLNLQQTASRTSNHMYLGHVNHP